MMNYLFKKPIGIFYLISCMVSWPFMIWMQFYTSSWNNLFLPQPLKVSFFMWGPGIAALLCWKFVNPEQQLSRYRLFTGGVWLNLAVYILPLILFVVLFHQSLTTQQMLFFLTLYSIVAFFNTCGEELGWRGFLQANLKHISSFKRFLLLGLMWELWHLPMRLGAWYAGTDLVNISLISLGTFILTFLIGFYIEKTQSVSSAISLHAFANTSLILSELTKIPVEKLLPYFICGLVFYILVYFLWDQLKR